VADGAVALALVASARAPGQHSRVAGTAAAAAADARLPPIPADEDATIKSARSLTFH